LLKRIRMATPNAMVILNGRVHSTNAVIEAMRLGAFDVLRREAVNFELRGIAERALAAAEQMRIAEDRGKSDPIIPPQPTDDLIIGRSPAMQDVYKLIGRVARADAPVLITGESGVGKEVVSNAIHKFSRRAKAEYVAINCAAIPSNLLESELFGHEKGAFTGAVTQRIGRFEQCHGGTLFLDEIGDMPLEVQSKLLRVLQSGEFSRVGGNQTLQTDVRILAATNKRLEEEVEHGTFREDLFYRLNVVRIHIPPLRQRLEDIRLLAEHFLAKRTEGGRGRPMQFSREATEMLEGYHWPGNVRERKRHSRERPAFRPGKPQPKRACHPRAGREAIPPGRRPCEGFPRRPGDAGPLRDRPARDRQRRKSSGAPRHFPGRVAFPRRYLHGSATRRSGKKGESSGSFRREGPPGLIRT
jgi:DNA-binding NtrC family response regulator